MKKADKSSGGKPDAPLLQAAEEGNLNTVRERLAAGADVNAATKKGTTALIGASRGGHLLVVQELINAGANVNCIGYPSGGGLQTTPLYSAVEGDNWEMVQVLLNARADMAIEPLKDINAVAEAAEKACRAHFTLTASEEEWLSSKKRTREVIEKARVDGERWMQFIRDAIAKGVKIRDYALWSAVNYRFQELATLLLSAGVNPNAAPHGTSVLIRAIERGENEIALALIKAGANVNLAARIAPVLVAVAKGNVRLAGALLDAGADINVTGNITISASEDDFNAPVAEASTALIVAARFGNEALVKLLLERGADANIADKQGVTALAWATRENKPAIVELLSKGGAKKPEFLEGSLSTALWTAAKNGDAAKVRDLLSRGAKPDESVEDREGRHLPLVSAAREGHLEVVQLLFQNGANANAVAVEDWTADLTPLMVAARNGHVEIIKALLAAKADVGAKDKAPEGGSESALHYAARGGHAEAIKALLAAGAKVNAKAKGGNTPLCVAASKKQYDAAKALLDAGADPNAGPSDGSGPLYTAAMEGSVELVKLLLERGAKPMPPGGKADFIPLDTAASKGSVEIVQLLLKAGAPVNAQGVCDGTALASAALYGREEIVKILLAAGADPNLVQRGGFTPLMGALRSGNEVVVRLLLEAGADANAALDDGKDVLAIAKESKNKDIVPLIEAAAKQKPAPASSAKKSPTPPKPSDDEESEEEDEGSEAPDFSEVSASESFQAVLREVEKLCGAKTESLEGIEGGYAFSVPEDAAKKLLAEHHEPLLKKGAYLFRFDRGVFHANHKLGLLPTTDWTDLIRAFQTNGANYNLMPADIAKWLEKLSRQQPFIITGASWDWLEGRFTTAIKNPRKLAHQLYEFCPDIVDQGAGTVKELANLLEKDGYFFLWWD